MGAFYLVECSKYSIGGRRRVAPLRGQICSLNRRAVAQFSFPINIPRIGLKYKYGFIHLGKN